MLPGDLVARLRWMAEHDRAALLGVLATVDPRALALALRLAGKDGSAGNASVGPSDPAERSCRGRDAP